MKVRRFYKRFLCFFTLGEVAGPGVDPHLVKTGPSAGSGKEKVETGLLLPEVMLWRAGPGERDLCDCQSMEMVAKKSPSCCDTQFSKYILGYMCVFRLLQPFHINPPHHAHCK